MTGRILVGTSGFSYPTWKGAFYPSDLPDGRMLEHYATRLGAVEINYTFRRRLAAPAVERWRKATDERFAFAVKASFFITHMRRLRDAGGDVQSFVDLLAPLGARLGPILFQTPTNLLFEHELLETFFASLPAGFTYALEPLHRSFDDPALLGVLRRHGVALCLNDDRSDATRYEPTGPVAYLRFRHPAYEPDELDQRAVLVRDLAERGTDVYVFFRHTDDPACALLALEFQERTREAAATS